MNSIEKKSYQLKNENYNIGFLSKIKSQDENEFDTEKSYQLKNEKS